MKNIEQQFEALIPEGEKRRETASIPKKEDEAAFEKPYIDIKESSVSYLGVEVPKGEGGRLTPSTAEFKEEYFYLEGHYRVMREVATALLLNKPILLEGGTGVYNKTTTISRMCRDLNMNYCKVNFDRETAREDVIGGQTLKIDENGKEHLEWYDGDMMYAIRNGGVAFLDEYNRQSKLSGIINPIIDAILNGRKEITNPYNENERVRVHPNFRLVAAQNPPGMEEGHEYTDRSQLPAETFGRWIYRKLPIEYSEEEENKLLAGMIGEKVDLNLPETEFRRQGEGIPIKELAEIPGMIHWRRETVTILRLLEAKSSGAKREMAKDQRQKLYFNPRLKNTILEYIAKFYSGDINETVKNAFETCIIGMYNSDADKQKIRLILDQAEYKLPVAETKRKGLEKKETAQSSLKDKTEKELAELMASSEIPDSVKDALRGKETKLSPDILEQVKEAKAIFGKDFLGPDEIKSVFGAEALTEVPPITFSREELERAKELGQMLILRQPITMEEINDKLAGKVKDGKKLLYSVDESTGKLKDDAWYKDEEFYKNEKPEAKWVLVSKETISDSTKKNYIEQTDKLIEYLQNQVFKDKIMPKEYQEAIDEYLRAKKEIAKTMKPDWQKAAQILEELKITELTRQSPAEVLYDLVAYYQTTGERLLPNRYTWTRRRGSDGELVGVGGFGSDGVRVISGSAGPDYSYGRLGVSFSRSL